MSYRNPKQPKWLTRGSGCGCAVLLLSMIASFPFLVARASSCNHQIPGSKPCDIHADRVIVLVVLIAAIGLAGLTKWAFDRGDSSLDDDRQ
jgi:hypothetical protein